MCFLYIFKNFQVKEKPDEMDQFWPWMGSNRGQRMIKDIEKRGKTF